MTRSMSICSGDGPIVPDDSDCEYNHIHTPSPKEYLAWHAWAEKMQKTHRKEKCPGCGLYKIVVPKTLKMPTFDKPGTCECGHELPPQSEWNDAGRDWANIECSQCGKYYVDEDVYIAMYPSKEEE